MKTLFKIVGALFAKLPFCSLAGVIVGSSSGFVMAIFELENPTMVLISKQLIVIGLLLGITGFLLVLYFLGLLLRYGVGAIFWPSLANALITSLLTAPVTYSLHKPALAGFVGLLIGILVGAVLCWLCRARGRSVHAKA